MSLEFDRPFLLRRPRVTSEQWGIAQDLASGAKESLGALLDAGSSAPTWLVLAALAELEPVLFHGTSAADIEWFEPRKCDDTNPFGAQLAVYATADPLWAMFYAALDRNPPFSLLNGCSRTIDDEDLRSDPYYFFSISKDALERQAFSPGFIYVLPRDTFVREPERVVRGHRIEVDHWASLESVRPLGRVSIRPEDFPFLESIRGHDDAVLWQRIEADPDRFPWVDEMYAGEGAQPPRPVSGSV